MTITELIYMLEVARDNINKTIKELKEIRKNETINN